MIHTLPWQTPARNYYPLPKVLCQLGLSPGEIAVYSFLMYCENRTTYQCYPSYRTIGEAVGMSRNTVAKYVRQRRGNAGIYVETGILCHCCSCNIWSIS